MNEYKEMSNAHQTELRESMRSFGRVKCPMSNEEVCFAELLFNLTLGVGIQTGNWVLPARPNTFEKLFGRLPDFFVAGSGGGVSFQ